MRKIFIAFFLFISIVNVVAQENEVEKIVLKFRRFKSPDADFEIDLKKRTFEHTATYPVDKDPFFHQTYTYTEKDFKKLKTELWQDMPETTVIKEEEEAFDGGGFVINYVKKHNDTMKLIVFNPIRENIKYSGEFRKLDTFFDFAYTIIKDASGIDALDQTYRPYFEGLPIRKVSDDPLKYRVWGSISGNSSDEDDNQLTPFLDQLPKDQCIVIDCNHQLSWAWQNDILKKYILKGSNIHFVNNQYLKYMCIHLLEMRNIVKTAEDKEAAISQYKKMNYDSYMIEPDAVNKWMELPENYIFMTVEEMREQCRQ